MAQAQETRLLPRRILQAEWHYVLLAEDVFYKWRDDGVSIREMLEFARLRPIDERVQAQFAF